MKRTRPVFLSVIAVALTGCSSATSVDGDADSDADVDADSDGDVDEDADDMPSCPPAMEDVSVQWTIDGYTMEEVDLDIPCRVTAVVGEEVGHTIVSLECGTGGILEHHELDIVSSPAAWFGHLMDTEVVLRYVAAPVWWIDRFFTIRNQHGHLLLAGVDAESIAPYETDPTVWYEPLDPAIVSGACQMLPVSCGTAERQGIELTYGGETETIFEGQSSHVGMMASFHAIVDQAHRYDRMDCDDVPDTFYTALFVLVPEG